MIFRVTLFALLVGRVVSFKSSPATPLSFDKDFGADTEAGRNLIESSTLVNGSRSLDQADYNFVGQYSIKFLDCHSVNQWNGDSESDGDDDKGGDSESKLVIATSLVRFRLCPTSSCQGKSSSGCSSKYGDYLVDVNTFVYNYLTAQADLDSDLEDYCYNYCGYSDDGNCKSTCIESNGGSGRAYSDDDSVSLDPLDYAKCSAYNDDYYLGPYCSIDGESVLLGVFSDESCTQFSSCTSSCFYSNYGFYLPYTQKSMIAKNCLSCSYNYVSQQKNANYDYGPSNSCKAIYSLAGKCETRLPISYPNDSACKYIEGIKYLQKDGVISSNSVKRSKGASLGIGMLTFTSILLGIYVHYLSISKSTMMRIQHVLAIVLSLTNSSFQSFSRIVPCQVQSFVIIVINEASGLNAVTDTLLLITSYKYPH